MAQYDGSVVIKTDIDTKGANSQLSALENRMVKTADKIASLRSKMDSLKDMKIPTQEYENLQKELSIAQKEMEKMTAQDGRLKEINSRIDSLSASSAKYAEEMRKVGETKIPTQEYADLDKELSKLGAEFDRIAERQRQFIAGGGKEKDSSYQKMEYSLNTIDAKQDRVIAKMKEMENAGKAFTLGVDTDKYQQLSEKQEAVNRKLEEEKAKRSEIVQKQAEAVQKTIELDNQVKQLVADGKAFTLGQNTEEFSKLGQDLSYAGNDMAQLNQRHDELIAKQNQVVKSSQKMGNTAKKSFEKINKSAKKSAGAVSSFVQRLKSIAATVFVFNLIRKAFNAMVSGIKEGFQNLYNGSESFKNSVDSLKASAATLKNALAAAFEPIVQIAIPYIQKLIEWLTAAVDKFGQFIAALTGQKTYTRAVKQTAGALEDEADAAEDANKQLSGLDKLNNMTTSKNASSSSSGTSTGDMFEEVPIDSGILDFLDSIKEKLQPILDYLNKLKDIFMEGFWDGLGDWEYRWDSIKDSIASIKESLKDIFTDPAVLAAADSWAQSVAYMLGSLAGSMASIGLTIATNLLGGIAKYLEQNKDRIKNYLIDMFNIWEEVNYLFADLFQSIAYVFEAFASEDGQQLTANIIGIFLDTFMGVTELASKLFRDIANIIIKPFVDNKEGFRTALEGFLGVLAEVTGTIKQGIDDTFDKLNEVYDEHLKPFFDSVAQGLSDLVGKFLEFWNGNVQPILEEWAAKFDTLWKEHIQPLLNNAAELLGSVADLLKALWEKVLQPFIGWIIDNVLPKVLPILQSIYDTVVTVIGDIADLLSGFIGTVKEIINLIVALINGDWDAAWEAARGIVENVFNMIYSFVATILDAITGVIDTALQVIVGIVDSIAAGIKSLVESALSYIKENIVGKLTEIKTGFANFKTNVSQAWSNLWTSLKDKVKSVMETIKSIIQSKFEWITNKISSIKSAISGIKSAASSAFGGSGSSSSASSYSLRSASATAALASLSDTDIPAYATGQVIPTSMKKHLAILGDNNKETEVVSPLSTIEQAVVNAMAKVNAKGNGGNVTVEIPVYLNGNEIGRAMQTYNSEWKKSNGASAFA